MTRLRHSLRGFVKSLQISTKVSLFAFVEGKTDRYFYDRICSSGVALHGLNFAVRTADELPSNSRGKTAILEFFTYLRSQKLLAHEFKGKKMATVFFVDKDVDDLLRIQKRSAHLVYTEFYQQENYLMKHSNLVEVAASAASLDVQSVQGALGDQEQWRRKAATQWKEWIKLCLITRHCGANSPTNYERSSQVNVGIYGGTDSSLVQGALNSLQLACGLDIATFQRLVGRCNRLVERIYAQGLHDRVFKGRWYAVFLAEDVRRAAAGRSYKSSGLEQRLLESALNRVDFGQPWSANLRAGVASVAQLLMDGDIRKIV